MTFVVIARYRIKADCVSQVRAALGQMLEPTRAEPGCLAYDAYTDPEDMAVAVLVERYVSKAAFEDHLASEHFGRLVREIVLPGLAERVRLDLVPLAEGAE